MVSRARINRKFTYANVMSTIAVVIALGVGTSQATTWINGALLKPRSVGTKKLKNKSITAAKMAANSVGTTSIAAGGVTTSDLATDVKTAGGDLTGTLPSPRVELASSDSGGTQSAFATSCSTTLASVTFTVPASGLVEVMAWTDMKNGGGSATVIACLNLGGLSTGTLLNTNSVAYQTRYVVQGSVVGTTSLTSVGWSHYFMLPGEQTITFLGGHTGGGTGDFTDSHLLVRSIS